MMNRALFHWTSAAVLCATIGCSSPSSEPTPPAVAPASSPDAFVGTWRSVTPGFEFIGLSVASKSSQVDVLGARLTFSGVAWEGGGKIDGDSLVANMAVVGSPTSSGVIVAYAADSQSLRLHFRPTTGAAADWKFVREP